MGLQRGELPRSATARARGAAGAVPDVPAARTDPEDEQEEPGDGADDRRP